MNKGLVCIRSAKVAKLQVALLVKEKKIHHFSFGLNFACCIVFILKSFSIYVGYIVEN